MLAVAGAIALSVRTPALAQGQAVGWGFNAFNQTSPPNTAIVQTIQVAAGETHTVVLRADGTLASWGRNEQGQTTIPTGLGPVKRVAAGGFHTVALSSNGSVRCWGLNDWGQCSVPSNLGTAVAVAAGAYHTAVITSSRSVRCWGQNSSGQCNVPANLGPVTDLAAGTAHNVALRADGTVASWGDNSSGQCNVPPGLTGVTQVAAGGLHSAALRSDGRAVCWGLNNWGQCNVPPDLVNVRQIATGYGYTIALRRDGSMRCWGHNGEGQIDIPADAVNVTQLALGRDHTVALKSDGSVRCWGNNNNGQCSVPRTPNALVQVAGGGYHTVALQSDGTVACWGNNFYWAQSTPPDDLQDVMQVAAGGYHSAALKTDGTVVCWGYGFDGQTAVPADLGPVVQLSAGGYHTLAVRSDKTVRCWGRNSYGQCSVPAGLASVRQAAGGAMFSAAVRENGSVACWGDNEFGQCNVPFGASNVSKVSAGGYFTMALRSNGTVQCWGYNGYGQCNVPLQAVGVTDISAGFSFAMALKSDGTVLCWGLDEFGQSSPPAGLSNVSGIAAGYSHAVALLSAAQSSCSNPTGSGTARLSISGAAWQNVGIWTWSGGAGPQVPGALSAVTLGEYGSVGSLCDAQCASLDVPSTSTLLVPLDLTRSSQTADHAIEVSGLARLQGRVWLVASGASALPGDLFVPVVRSGEDDGVFSIIQSTVAPPPGKFLTLVPWNGAAGGAGWALALRDLPIAFNAGTGGSYSVDGQVIRARTMDLNGDGFSDLALVISNGPEQPGILQVILNDGAGNMSTTSYITETDPRPTALAIGRVNGDELDDVVVCTLAANPLESVARIYLNSFADTALGGQVFTPSTSLEVGAEPISTTVVGSGPPLIAVGTSTGSVKIFTPQSPIATETVSVPVTPKALGTRRRQILSPGPNPNSADGLVPNATGKLVVMAAGTGGTYAITQEIDVPGKPSSLDVADIDRDGIDDVITANSEPIQGSGGNALAVLTLFKGTEAGFGNAIPIAPDGATAGGDVAMVDVNGDGVRDIISVHATVGGESEAVAIQIDQYVEGGPLTIGQQDRIAAESPILCPRGDVLGPAGEGVFIVESGATALAAGGPLSSMIPYRADMSEPPPACVADLDASGAIDGADLARLLAGWGLDTPGIPADINRDGRVDGIDLTLLLAAWGPCQSE